MFGRRPRLPVDHMLGLDLQDDQSHGTDDWVAGLRARLTDAIEKAIANLQKEGKLTILFLYF